MAEANPSIPGNTNSVRPAPRQDKGLSLFIAIQPEMITEHFLHSNDLMLNSSYIVHGGPLSSSPLPLKATKLSKRLKQLWWAGGGQQKTVSLLQVYLMTEGRKYNSLLEDFTIFLLINKIKMLTKA